MFESINREELVDLSNEADEVLAKLGRIVATLERIGELAEKLPTEDDLHEVERSLGSIACTLEQVGELSENLPAVE